MSKSKKKTASQQVMGIAALAMPAPVRDLVTSRWGARISLLLAAALIGSGVLSLQWTDGKPHVQVNRDRAHEVEQKVEQRLEKFQEQHEEQPRFTDRFGFGKKR